MLDKGKHFLLLTVSTLIMAIGTYFFKFTNNFTFGGITGLAVLIAKTGLMTAGDFNFVASMTLLVIGMIVLGKKFAAKTASALGNAFFSGARLPDESSFDRPADAGALFCDCTSGSWLCHFVQHWQFQWRYRYYCYDFKKIFQLQYRTGSYAF